MALKVTRELIAWISDVDVFVAEIDNIDLQLHMSDEAIEKILDKVNRSLDSHGLGIISSAEFQADKRLRLKARLEALCAQLDEVAQARPIIFGKEVYLPEDWSPNEPLMGDRLRSFVRELSGQLFFLQMAIS